MAKTKHIAGWIGLFAIVALITMVTYGVGPFGKSATLSVTGNSNCGDVVMVDENNQPLHSYDEVRSMVGNPDLTNKQLIDNGVVVENGTVIQKGFCPVALNK